ncbi:MAG: pitrilysin family protein [Clostridium sp.]
MYEMLTLGNGLKIVLEHIPHVKSISVGLWIKNGSRNEDEKRNGMSHFIEHMFFKGTKNRGAKEIVESIEELGGQLNAFTGKEATCYYAKVLDEHLELALEVLSDMIFNSNFDEEEIEKEKLVVLEEISMDEDNPEDVLSNIHYQGLFGNDPITYPILGTKDTVKGFSREELIEFMEKQYTPKNSTLSISGNFDKNHIYKLIEKYFGFWTNNYHDIVYNKPDIVNENYFKCKDIEQLHLSIALKGYPIGHKNLYTLVMLTNLLGGGSSSILFQKFREELGMCYAIYAYPSSMVNIGTLYIYIGLNKKHISKALATIEDELKKFSQIKLSKEKFSKAKEQIKGSYILGLESTSSRMFANGKSVLFLNKINKPEEVLKSIDSISYEDIENVMKDIFEAGIQNIALVGSDYKFVSEEIGSKYTIINYDSITK